VLVPDSSLASPRHLLLDDMDGDGDPNLATDSEDDRIVVLSNRGDGSFGPAAEFDLDRGRERDTVLLIRSGDVLGDGGRQILVFVRDGQTLLLEPGDEAPPTVDDVSPATVTAGTQRVVAISGSGFAPGATLDLGEEIEVLDTTFLDAGHLEATVAAPVLPAYRPQGIREDVVVENPSGAGARAKGAFFVEPSPGFELVVQKGSFREAKGRKSPRIRASGVFGEGGVEAFFAAAEAGGDLAITVQSAEDPRLSGPTYGIPANSPPWIESRNGAKLRMPIKGHFRLDLKRKSKRCQWKLRIDDLALDLPDGRIYIGLDLGDVSAGGTDTWREVRPGRWRR
jgi:hypothetical protein